MWATIKITRAGHVKIRKLYRKKRQAEHLARQEQTRMERMCILNGWEIDFEFFAAQVVAVNPSVGQVVGLVDERRQALLWEHFAWAKTNKHRLARGSFTEFVAAAPNLDADIIDTALAERGLAWAASRRGETAILQIA